LVIGIQVKAGAAKPAILVVDDQPAIRQLLFEALQDDRWEVRLASGAFEALQQVACDPPTLAIIDLRLPGMSGLELLREMRKLEYRGEVLVLSAYSDTDLLAEARALGASYWLTKPFDLDDLQSLVEEVMFGRQERSELLS
jgi:two-component system response regulator (stage 0 sporulation protein F)